MFLHIFAYHVISQRVKRGNIEGSIKSTVCKFCINCVKDEYHFMFICKVYDDLRRMYTFNTFNKRNMGQTSNLILTGLMLSVDCAVGVIGLVVLIYCLLS